MDVVLLERVEKLGQMGDVVAVKPGFARNFLLPQGKALRATKGNIARFEAERAQLEARNLEKKAEAERVFKELDGEQFVVIRSASESGALYGSVTPRDASEAATAGGFSVDRRQVIVERPVKDLGLHEFRVQLHPEVIATITVNVARSQEEAELQATGKTIADARAEAEAEADSDIAQLFDDVGGAAEEEGDERRSSGGLMDDPRGEEDDDDRR